MGEARITQQSGVRDRAGGIVAPSDQGSEATMTMSAMVPSVFGKGLNELQLQRTGPRANATAGEPVESEVELFNDGRVQLGVWECTAGEFPSVKEGISEQMYFLAGDATIVGDDGTTHQIAPGSLLVTPDGWSGRWEIRQTVRKIYTIWQTR